MVAQMSIQPHMALKRAENFDIVEVAAVTFAAQREGATSLKPTPSFCNAPDALSNCAYSITCTKGKGTPNVQTLTRSFRLQQRDNNDCNSGHGYSVGYDCFNPGKSGFVKALRVFGFSPPSGFTWHQCLITDY